MPSDTYQTYLFDLDGTLLNSIELCVRAFEHAYRAGHGADAQPPSEAWVAGIGTPLEDQMRRFAPDEAGRQRMHKAYRAYYISNHNQWVRLYDQVEHVLAALTASGKRMGIVTSKSRIGTDRSLSHTGLQSAGLFDIVVCVEDTERNKPHPDPVRHAMERMDADPQSTVFIGDSSHDMAAGRAAGVHTAAALWGPFARDTLEAHEPVHFLAQVTDILTL